MSTNVIGQPLARVDGRAKVTGGARYAADFNQPGQALCGDRQRDGRPRPRSTGIDSAAVDGMPGVVAVITPPQCAATGLRAA